MLSELQKKHIKEFIAKYCGYHPEHHKNRKNPKKKYFTIEEKKTANKIKKDKYRRNNPHKIKLNNKRNKAMRKAAAGYISTETIQRVYEDNIKKYGTLTCIYCLNRILFGQDTLEHRTPLSRNGTNLYENLAISCYRCNVSKNNKTEEEYKKWIAIR